MLSLFKRKKRTKKRTIQKMVKRSVSEALLIQEQKNKKQLDSLYSSLQTLQNRQKKLENLSEDILDTMEGHFSILEEEAKKDTRELELIEHIIQYDEQLNNIRLFMEKKEDTHVWAEQITLLCNSLKPSMAQHDLIKIDTCHIPVDFNLHEVIQIEETSNLKKQELVSQIIVPGWIYKNTVLQKAKIVAYKYQTNE